MRRSSTAWLSAAALLTAAAPAAAAETTRVFALQPKLDLAWMESRDTYRAKLVALQDKEVAPNLRPDGRNFVAWPEDLGLWAALTGQRAEPARQSGSLEGSIVTLIGLYAPQNSYYQERYPDLGDRGIPTRLLALSLTDTFGRVALETFSELAAKHHVWLEAGVNMAQEWHVVCVGGAHPPQELCDEENPQKVQQLGDPFEPDRQYAYEATTPNASNMALVFNPEGKLVSKQVKQYITPIELGQTEGQLGLDLVPGRITGGLNAVDTPVGRFGFVTSKDAWMPDVIDKLEAYGVDVLVQPEFFVGDVATDSGMWAADTLLASGYNDLLRHPGFTALVLPSAVGSVFNFTADEQTHIAVRSAKPGHLIGQPASPGLTALPWVVPDPLSPNEDFVERRKRLAAAGKALAPGSGVKCEDPSKPGPCELGHVEGALFQDVPVGRPARAQTNPVLATRGKTAVLAYEEGNRIRVRLSRDGGRRWSKAVALGTGAWPSVGVGARQITVAWTGAARVMFARSPSKRLRFGFATPIAGDSPDDVNQWKPALAQGTGDVVHSAFVDERERSADGNLPQAHVYYSRIEGGKPSKAVRLDTEKPAPPASKLDHSWSPSITANGRDLLVSWLDFAHYDWDVFARRSGNDGRTFADAKVLNKEPAEVENLSDTPRSLLTDRGPVVVWTDWHKRELAVTAPHPQYDIYLAKVGGDPLQVDPNGGGQVSTFWPSACVQRNDVLVAYQQGADRIRLTRVRGGKKRGATKNVGRGTRPALACSRNAALIAFEDAKSRVRTAVVSRR